MSERSSEIASVDCIPVRLPLRKPMLIGSTQVGDAPILFIRIRTPEGLEGWGEASADLFNAGETLSGMVALVEQAVIPRLLGRSLHERRVLNRDLRKSLFANTGALAAIDMALLDLAAKYHAVPACELLGGAMRRDVPVMGIIGGPGCSSAEVCDQAIAQHEAGVRLLKIKLGTESCDEDIETFHAVRQAVGNTALLCIDANMRWSVETALKFARGVQAGNPAFLEQPVASNVAHMRALAQRSPVPIAADEAIHSVEDLLTLARENAICGAALKSIKIGGIGAMVEAAVIASSLGLSIGVAMMMESSLATAAMVHAACAMPQVDWGINPGNLFLAEDPVRDPIVSAEGKIAVPQRPGLGVEIDEARLRSFFA